MRNIHSVDHSGGERMTDRNKEFITMLEREGFSVFCNDNVMGYKVKRNYGCKSILVTSDCGEHHCLAHISMLKKYRKNMVDLTNQVNYRLRYMRRC